MRFFKSSVPVALPCNKQILAASSDACPCPFHSLARGGRGWGGAGRCGGCSVVSSVVVSGERVVVRSVAVSE